MGKDDKYFIVGLLSLALSLFLMPLSLFLLPQACFGWNYHIPDFVINWNNWLQDAFALSEQDAEWWVVGGLFVLSLVFAGIAYYTSTRPQYQIKPKLTSEHLPMDNHHLKPVRQDRRETVFLVIKIVVIMMLVYLIAQLMQWAIAVSPAR
ncbi:MAG: hypothetical protein A3F46_07730 [Legionellales bacterium RIFCSPHIGHO2_12_FULL_42_9]|nr:MAG: hypothetical protein A3F46_07730 [Legionellales bacterium RIFCSPHIGHO2_12_FULL_42_9]